MWQPIETAPKDGSYVDLWGSCKDGETRWEGRFPDCHWGKLYARDEDDWIDDNGMGMTVDADYGADLTHWMAVPDPPAHKSAPNT
jgi:hypothetical protein